MTAPDPTPGFAPTNAPAGPAERQVSTQAAAGGFHLRPLVRLRVRQELKAALKGAKRGKGTKAKGLTGAEQSDLFNQIGPAELDAAIQEAETQGTAAADGRAGGPLIDFLTSEQFIQLVVSILLKFLGV